MNDKLREYLEKCRPAEVNQSLIDELHDVMDEAVPEIAERVRQRELLAAHLRSATSRPSQSGQEKQD